MPLRMSPEAQKIFVAKQALAAIANSFGPKVDGLQGRDEKDDKAYLQKLLTQVNILKGYESQWAATQGNDSFSAQVKKSVEWLFDKAFAETAFISTDATRPGTVALHKDRSREKLKVESGNTIEGLDAHSGVGLPLTHPVLNELRTALSDKGVLAGLAQMYADCGGDPQGFAKITKRAGTYKIPIVDASGRKEGWVRQ